MTEAIDFYTQSEWYRELTEYLEAVERPGLSDVRLERLHDKFRAATTAVFRKPVRTFEDLILLAAIAHHWNPVDDTDPKRLDDRAVACLVRGVLTLAGLELDAEGRLLSP